MTLDRNVTGVNDLVISSCVLPKFMASSDGGEDSRADFLVAVWMWALMPFEHFLQMPQ